MKKPTRVSLIVLTVAVCGCGLFEDEGDFQLLTDRRGYEPGATISVTATNNSSEVIYYNTCMPAVMEELSDDGVVAQIGFPTCACLCIEELEPGESWDYEVDGTWLWQNMGPSQPKIGPRYRFFLPFYGDNGMKRLLRPDELITNTFRFEPHVR